GVALAGNRAELVGNREALFVRGYYGREQFAGEFVPKVVQKILHRAAQTSVIVGCAQEDDISPIDPSLEFRKSWQVMCRIRGVLGQRFLEKIQYVDGATRRPELFGNMLDHDARDRPTLKAANYRQHIQWSVCHSDKD